MIRHWLAMLFVVLGVAVTPAFAQERIANFASDIVVAANGTLTVTETISIVSEGDRIQRGIFRDFPTIYRDGIPVRIRFDVESVMRDGNPEPYILEAIDNGRRVRIGDADILLAPGAHTYTITYRTDRQIGFFDTYDELYWNVTGNASVFPITRAQATILLPEGANITQSDFYTGPEGAQDKNAIATIEDNRARFATTASLAPREGLTVAVGFPKGIIAPPTEAEQAEEFIRDTAGIGAAWLGLFLLTAFYFTAWWRYGRDPQRGVVIPLFAPPRNLSAAAIRFIHRMAYDRKAFSAALIAMAVKGYIKITEGQGTYALTRTGKNETEAGLQSTEKAITKVLFNVRNEIELKNSNHAIVSRAISAQREALKREDEGVYFVSNSGWFFGGLAILIASGIAAAMLAEDPAPALVLLVFLAGLTWATSFLFVQLFGRWRSVFAGPGSRVFNFFGAIFLTLFFIPFAGGLVMAITSLGVILPALTVIAVVLQGLIAAIFHRLLKAPTLLGAKVRDEIEGFRLFLVTAEKTRLEILHPPKVTPEIFEKFLPYAIALDAENAWSRKFEAEIVSAGQAPDRHYTPGWYAGPSYNRLGTTGFVSSLGTSVASATAAAATAPGRSSGSGGGGSSGGGGGGGGVGGW